MNERNRPQRAFIAVTLMTVIAVTTVFLVYAIVLSTINGGNVVVVSVKGEVKYDELNSSNDADWATDISNRGNGDSWYAMLNTTGTGYSGGVTVTFILQNDTGTWANVTGGIQAVSFTLTGAVGNEIYAATSGTGTDQANNKNWGALTTNSGTYRIRVVIEKA